MACIAVQLEPRAYWASIVYIALYNIFVCVSMAKWWQDLKRAWTRQDTSGITAKSVNVVSWCGWDPLCLNCSDAARSDHFMNQSQRCFQSRPFSGFSGVVSSTYTYPALISRFTVMHDITVQMGLLHALSQGWQSMTKQTCLWYVFMIWHSVGTAWYDTV